MVRIVKQQVWDPRQDLMQLQHKSELRDQERLRPTPRQSARVFPTVIISTAADRLVVRAEVPGMELKDFELTVSGDTLTIEGVRVAGQGLSEGWYHRREREGGRFSRAVRLPAVVDGDSAEATYTAGVLAISLPLREAPKPTAISVKVSEA